MKYPRTPTRPPRTNRPYGQSLQRRYEKPGPVKSGPSTFAVVSTGMGFLKRITEVTPIEGMPYLVARIAALSGDVKNAREIYFDARVSGTHAHEWVRFLANDVAHGSEVLIRFRMRDVMNQFTQANDPHAGLQTRLIAIDSARVDDQDVRPMHRQAA